MTTLKSTSLAACPVHVILFNVLLKKRQWIIDHVNILVGFILVYYSEDEIEKR